MKIQKQFYSHIVDTSTITLSLGEMDLAQEERVYLISLVEGNLHHAIVDAVLSELGEEDKKEFLLHLHSNEHGKIWDLLNNKVENIEDKIKKAAEDLKKELHKDIEEAKKKK